MKENIPTIRLHLWLDTDDGVFFGSGRAQLLEQIDRHGSLKAAAEAMGISYRAAWGKLKQSEDVLGVRLVQTRGSNKAGYELTEDGRMLKDMFRRWFDSVEQAALEKAREIFPWPARPYRGDLSD
ncbi:MAG TPA: LysR family transcriptional regulator [Desulfovibrio sp.]|jgi:molybdate transport system regulatory protein|uniref:winged helix-turn-helix domain-containing protein n=1 Tax=Desulfovibrio TaxID=872 RepID=UPI002A39DF9D|nr:LysR family transcriptional regulator [Desulfovibrio sp.]MDY0306772.1 LysR family transcriptional regulator [Desulfovibrionaceae bacterium]HMM37717.1 LysR family transcriptional regulator [Desulfovibrio sp.]